MLLGKGPGSDTGVRIGVTIAKTLAWTLNIPLVGISSLEALAAGQGVTLMVVYHRYLMRVGTNLYRALPI